MSAPILDACCGSRMFYFDKEDPRVLFQDIRDEAPVLSDGRTIHIRPNVVADFRRMPHATGTFKMVVFDPPHFDRAGDSMDMYKKYGRLGKDWREDIYRGFNECMRVLEEGGVLIFKWYEYSISVSAIIDCIGVTPLFGHKSGKANKTHWLCFIKDDTYLL